jgi:hypothetical protein
MTFKKLKIKACPLPPSLFHLVSCLIKGVSPDLTFEEVETLNGILV